MTETSHTIPSLEGVRARRDQILALATKHKAFNVRLFGSVARGESTSASDFDFLVTFQDGTSIFDQVGLWLDLQDLLGCEVDLLADHPEGGAITQLARQEAVPL